jgi:predicted DNA-binding ribbon-helix-helix protein
LPPDRDGSLHGASAARYENAILANRPRVGKRRFGEGEKDERRTDKMTGPGIVKRSVRIAGHATSISLEAPFWRALEEIAARRRVSLAALLSAIDAGRSGNLSSAVRLFVLDCSRRGELRSGGEDRAAGG